MGMQFMQQGVWVWGSRDVSGGRAGKCLARGPWKKRLVFSMEAVSMVSILPLRPWLQPAIVWSARWRVQWASHPTQHTTESWRSELWDSDWAASPSLRVRTGELGRGGRPPSEDHPPVVRSPPEKQLVWQASSLHQASYMSHSLNPHSRVGAIINLVLYVWGTVAQRGRVTFMRSQRGS